MSSARHLQLLARGASSVMLLFVAAGCDSPDDCKVESAAEFAFDGATRVPLELLCNATCAEQKRTYFDSLTCEAVTPDGLSADAGTPDHEQLRSAWLRRDGCGASEYVPAEDNVWPRLYNFDMVTGDLIGALRVDDVGTSLKGTSCESAAWIAGDILACADQTLSLCL